VGLKERNGKRTFNDVLNVSYPFHDSLPDTQATHYQVVWGRITSSTSRDNLT